MGFVQNITLKQMHAISKMNNRTVAQCLDGLENKFLSLDEDDRKFTKHMHDKLSLLIAEVGDPFLQNARLVAQQFKSLSRSSPTTPGDAFVIAFRVFTDTHSDSFINEKLEFRPLKSHMTQQHTYEDNPDIDTFSRRIHREFATEIEQAS